MRRTARRAATTGNTAPPTAAEIKAVETGWNDSRLALNQFFKAVNDGVGVKRLTAVPAKGEKYGRSKELYTQLLKDAALCTPSRGHPNPLHPTLCTQPGL